MWRFWGEYAANCQKCQETWFVCVFCCQLVTKKQEKIIAEQKRLRYTAEVDANYKNKVNKRKNDRDRFRKMFRHDS